LKRFCYARPDFTSSTGETGKNKKKKINILEKTF